MIEFSERGSPPSLQLIITMTSNSHPSINDRLLSPTKRSRLSMHPSADPSDCTANKPHLTYAAANKIIKQLSPDMVDNIFKFISGEEVMRTSDIARILSYFGCKEIMRARRVSKKWRDAAEMTLPTSEFVVDSVESYNAMDAMAGGLLSNLEHLTLRNLCPGNKYIDGEDPDEEGTEDTADYTTHDIDIISNFTKLRSLRIEEAPLNGIYPVLFNFPLLQEFIICESEEELSNPKWDLDMLWGLPSLKELVVYGNEGLSGNVRSLRVLKDTLQMVLINYCRITGNVMELADFPRLKELDFENTIVTGDIRGVGEDDFPALESLRLPSSVIGGIGYMFHSIAEVPSFMHAIHRLQRNPKVDWYDLWQAFGSSLSKRSPDWYDGIVGSPEPPFELQLIEAGARTGWSWSAPSRRQSCEINWLDPEPSSESSDYEAYMEEMHRIEQRINFYRGYNKPPNAVEYRRLCGGLDQRD
eukprot:scaffold26504_cov228-Skeletonema_dohrnii-CCMP3373.AAC.6